MRIRFLMFLLVTLSGWSDAHAQVPDAKVVSMTGTAVVREAGKSGTKPLKKGDPLFAGQRVICTGACKELIISYCEMNVPVPKDPKGKLIVSINCNALEGVRAGGPKGEAVTIISPKESELVRPDTLSVKWNPSTSPIKLALKVYLGEQIWGPQTVDGSKGSFTSESFKAALRNAQKADDLHLVLILDAGNEPLQRVKFDIISVVDQLSLDKKLSALAGESNPVLRALGRAMSFSEYELYTEATEELEKALAVSRTPMDRQNLVELRKLAIMAHYKAYNDARVRELCEAAKSSGSDLPEICK